MRKGLKYIIFNKFLLFCLFAIYVADFIEEHKYISNKYIMLYSVISKEEEKTHRQTKMFAHKGQRTQKFVHNTE